MNIPILLILFRLLLAPVILGLTYFIGENAKITIVILMYLGLISDILDGIIARKQNISSAKLRRMDSQTDMIFWLSLGISTWILYPALIQQHQIAIWSILGMEIACYVISFLKFKNFTTIDIPLKGMNFLTKKIIYPSQNADKLSVGLDTILQNFKRKVKPTKTEALLTLLIKDKKGNRIANQTIWLLQPKIKNIPFPFHPLLATLCPNFKYSIAYNPEPNSSVASSTISTPFSF